MHRSGGSSMSWPQQHQAAAAAGWRRHQPALTRRAAGALQVAGCSNWAVASRMGPNGRAGKGGGGEAQRGRARPPRERQSRRCTDPGINVWCGRAVRRSPGAPCFEAQQQRAKEAAKPCGCPICHAQQFKEPTDGQYGVKDVQQAAAAAAAAVSRRKAASPFDGSCFAYKKQCIRVRLKESSEGSIEEHERGAFN